MERKYSKEQSSDEKVLYPPYPPYPPYHLMMQDYYYNKYQHGFYPSPSLHRSQEQHQQQQHQRHVINLEEEDEEKSLSHSELLSEIEIRLYSIFIIYIISTIC